MNFLHYKYRKRDSLSAAQQFPASFLTSRWFVILVKNNVSFQELFARFGLSWEFSDANFTKLQMFTCTLYGANKSESDVNAHRYQLFCSKQANIEGHKLRPCADCLYKHYQHAYYQQLFGKEHRMLSLQFQVQLEKGGSRTKVMSLPLQLTGWKAYRLQIQYWNWCLAHVCLFVKPHSVSTLLMDSTVQKCADLPHGAICNLMKIQRQL